MAENVTTSGTLKINNEADRIAVASILYKNGYTVKPYRFKKNGKSFESLKQCIRKLLNRGRHNERE